MIAADQPRMFPADVLVNVSSRTDATMLDRLNETPVLTVIEHRRRFCQTIGIAYDDVVFQEIIYGAEQPYDQAVAVTDLQTTKHAPGLPADALFTRQVGVGLFLPVADCVATVVYDPVARSLALLHLGRHSSLTDLVQRTIDRFSGSGSRPEDLVAWMSPSAGRDTYRLEYFEAQHDPVWREFVDVRGDGVYLDLPGYNRSRLVAAGLQPDNIHISSINTMTNQDYFSHASGDIHDRMAVVAMMR